MKYKCIKEVRAKSTGEIRFTKDKLYELLDSGFSKIMGCQYIILVNDLDVDNHLSDIFWKTHFNEIDDCALDFNIL